MAADVVTAATRRVPQRADGCPAEATDLYDSVRDIYYVKPVLRGWLHLIWFEIALVVGTVFIVEAHGARQLTSVLIYVPGVAGLFGVSALYHRGTWNPTWHARFQQADHAMIFVCISATATPAYLLANRDTLGVVGLSVMWAITAVVIAIHMVWMDAPELIVGSAFALVAIASAVAIPGVWIHAGLAPAILFIAGGVFHAIGAISYQRRSPDPSPRVFGYHEMFHAYTCIAAACQCIAVGLLLG